MTDQTAPWTPQRSVLRYLDRREHEAEESIAGYEPGSRTVAYLRRLPVNHSTGIAPWTREESVLHALSTHPLPSVRLAVAEHPATHDITRGLMLLFSDITASEVEALVRPDLGREVLAFLADVHALPLVSLHAAELLAIDAVSDESYGLAW